MRHIFCVLLSFSLFSFPALQAQTLTPEKVRESGEYVTGMGHASTIEEAKDRSVADLVSNISVNVESGFEYIGNKTDTDGKPEETSNVSMLLRTYSNIQNLANVRQFPPVREKDGSYTVTSYISRKDLDELFEKRKNKILEYLSSAIWYENQNYIGSAIHNYYWALMLLRTYPDGDALYTGDLRVSQGYSMLSDSNPKRQMLDDFVREVGAGECLLLWIPRKIQQMAGLVDWSVDDITEEDGIKFLTISVRYQDAPVRDFCYTYYDGQMLTPAREISNAKGQGTIELYDGYSEKKVRLTIDYAGVTEANHDNELAAVLKNTNKVTVNRMDIEPSSVKVAKDKKKSVEEADDMQTFAVQASAPVQENAVQYLNVDESEPYYQVYQTLLNSLRTHQYESVRPLCTDDGWNQFSRLVEYGKARLVGEPEILFYDNNGDITCRKISMSFSFQTNNHRTFTEDVVVHFNREHLITGVSFALEKDAAESIMNHKGEWGDNVKMTIVNFLETYKTAYALRRLDYLQQIFSDDALIIVGSVLKVKNSGEVNIPDSEKIKYTKLTKQEYLRNLERCFNSNEFINIKFADNNVVKGGFRDRSTGQLKNVFGIQVRQDYYSSNYGDTGYLFLIVDMEDPQNPVIHVRTWQAEKDDQFADGLISLTDFS